MFVVILRLARGVLGSTMAVAPAMGSTVLAIFVRVRGAGHPRRMRCRFELARQMKRVADALNPRQLNDRENQK